MKRTSLKRSFILSLTSLILCVAMLLGTTFAWFSETITSDINTIKSGNLDVELEYYKVDKTTGAGDWEVVTGKTNDIFDPNALWEPGYTEVIYLKVSNLGSLDLKYQLSVNVYDEIGSINVENKEFKLSDYIYYGIIESESFTEYEEREDALKAVTAPTLIREGYQGATKELADGKVAYVALVVYMPTTIGNEANRRSDAKQPEIDLGINLVATQMQAEEDSFGKDYDDGAYLPVVNTAAELKSALENGQSVKLGNSITLDQTIEVKAPTTTYSMRSVPATVIDLGGNTLSGVYNDSTGKHIYPISNYGNLVITNGTVEGRGIYNQAGATLTIEKATVFAKDYNGGACVWGYGADSAVYLNDATLIGNTGCVSSEGYVEINGGTYTCYSGISDKGEQLTSPTYNIRAYNGLKITDGTFTSRHGVISIGGGEAVIENGTYTILPAAKITSNVVYVYGNTDLTIKNGSFTFDNSVADPDSGAAVVVDSDNANAAIYNGTFIGMNGMLSGNAVAYGGKFNTVWNYNHYGNLENYLAPGYTAEQNENGDWVVGMTNASLKDALGDAQAGETIEVPAGNFTFPASDLKEGVTLNCAPGTVFEGNSKLNIDGATVIGATFSNPSGTAADQTINGTFKNCTFTGSNGLRWCYAGETVVFENCVFDGAVYGVHFDGGANEVLFKNCTISGFNTIAGAVELTTFEGCTFKSTGRSYYNGINLWGDTEMIDCTFVFDGKAGTEWVDLCGDGKTASFKNCVVTDGENTKGIETVVDDFGSGNKVIIDGKETVIVKTAEALNAALAGGVKNILITDTIEDATVKMPTTLENVTISSRGGNGFKNSTVMAHDGNSFSYVGLTFDGITFENSRISITGWRNNGAVVKNFTVNNCVFKNIDDTTNVAAIHFNMAEHEAVNNFTFTNSVIDGATGGSKSGIYAAVTGNVTLTDNVFNNIVFRPALLQIADCDGVADNIVISRNAISNTTRLQVYGTEEGPSGGPWTPVGTDTLKIAITENIFKAIPGQYICTWGINGEADLSHNYFDVDITKNLEKIYWNNIVPTDVAGLKDLGVYPFYTELNEDGTINTDSLVEAQ